MSNYCSIGVDARIGLGFDKVRTQSRCLNKVCYCLEGIKKLFLKTPKVHQVIQYMEHYVRAWLSSTQNLRWGAPFLRPKVASKRTLWLCREILRP